MRYTVVPAVFVLAAASSMAAPGALDASFGNHGVASANIGPGSGGGIVSVALQADGRIVAVATSSTGTTPAVELLRYLADGTLDASFGASGRVAIAPPITSVAAVRVRPDGAILVAAQGGTSMLVLRFLANGTPDASFGQAGRSAIAVSGAIVSAMELMADGRIVLGGGNAGFFAAARLLADGSVDATFGGTGYIHVNVGAAFGIGTASAIAVRPDGGVLLAGTTFVSFSYFGGTLLARAADGSPDSSFAGGGAIGFGLNSGLGPVTLQADGKILLLGSTMGSSFLRRLNADGSDDATFNATGAIQNPGGTPCCMSVAKALAQADGKILVVGTRAGAHREFAAIRFLANGSVDATFSGTGAAGAPVGALDAGFADALVQPDGTVLFAGSGGDGQGTQYALARLTGAGAVDTTLGGTGSVTTTALGGTDDAARAVAIQADGRIVTAGTTRVGSVTRFAVARQLADGSPDTSFNTTGATFTPIRTGNDVARAVAVQPDGRIVAAGTSFNGANDDIAVVRYNVDGSLDTTFNGTGIVITPFLTNGDSVDEANAIALQPDGKIVIVGRCGFADGFTIVRYNTDGSLDTTFNGTGKASAQGTQTNVAHAVTVLADGRIAVAGYGYGGYPYGGQFALVLFNADGTLASAWMDLAGPFFTNHWAYAIAAQPDGKVLLAGGNVAGTASEILRLDANLVLDPAFANAGRYIAPGKPIQAMSLQKDGRIVALTQDFHAFRLYPDGSRDASFGTNGETVLPFSSAPTEKAMALQPDGRIVVAATAGTPTRGNDFALARLEGEPQGDFGFVMQVAVSPSVAITSNAVTYSGGPATISVAGGEYSIACTASFTATPGPIAGGMSVCVRHTSAAAFGTATTTTLTIGAQSGTFTSITLDAAGDRDGDGIPNAVEFAEARDARVKDNDVFGNARLFVMQQYRDMFGREGDVGGVVYWQDRVASGSLPRADLIQAFYFSSESGALAQPIARLYFATFLRTPDYAGLLFQIDAFRSGATLAQVANNFTLSPEFLATYGAPGNAQFVGLLYNNVLGRAAAQFEIDFHVARLAAGATRGEVLVGFSESPEYQAAIASEVYVTMMYVAMLRRAPEPAGLSYWVNYLDAGNSGLALIQGFLQSPEYHDRFLP